MIINFDIGDTNFIALVNSNRYSTFVNEDWNLPMIKEHFLSENKKKNIVVCQMTDEGIEADWKIEIDFKENDLNTSCFRKDYSYIKVDNGELCFVEYTCLTMAAQFSDEKVPDKYCDKFRFEIKNGLYKVNIIQYYDVDNDKHIGREDIDILFQLIRIDDVLDSKPKVLWYNL